MFNIKWKGSYTSEAQLDRIDPIYLSGLHKVKEVAKIEMSLLKGSLIMLPIIVLFLIIGVYSIHLLRIEKEIPYKSIVISLLVTSMILFILQYVHEIIHALLYPLKEKKEIYYMQGTALFVYCQAKVSKLRFIIICMAPTVLLGFVPFWLGVLFRNQIPAMGVIIAIEIGIFCTLMGVGDFYNIYNAIKQIPNGSILFNDGLSTYWQENNSKWDKNIFIIYGLIIFSIGLISIPYIPYLSILFLFVSLVIAMVSNGVVSKIMMLSCVAFILYLIF